MSVHLENSAVATGLEKVSFHFNLKERQCQRMLKLPHNCSFNISPSNEHPGLISFRMDGVNVLAVQGTLMSLLQHQHSNDPNIIRRVEMELERE